MRIAQAERAGAALPSPPRSNTMKDMDAHLYHMARNHTPEALAINLGDDVNAGTPPLPLPVGNTGTTITTVV